MTTSGSCLFGLLSRVLREVFQKPSQAKLLTWAMDSDEFSENLQMGWEGGWGILPIQKFSLHIFGVLNGLSYHNLCGDFLKKKCRKREGGRQTEAANTCLIILVFGTCGILSHRPAPEVGPWEVSVGGG